MELSALSKTLVNDITKMPFYFQSDRCAKQHLSGPQFRAQRFWTSATRFSDYHTIDRGNVGNLHDCP